MGRQLRPVSTVELSPRQRGVVASSVVDAAASGDHRATLVALRDRIAATVADPKCPPQALSALSRQLREIAKELAELDARAVQEAREDVGFSGGGWDEALI